MESWTDLWNVLAEIDGTAALALFVVGLKLEWWFMGGEVKRERARADRMEDLLLKALNVGERSTRIAEGHIYEFDHERRQD